jgi:apolipoprotein N-acyltransferase
VAEAGESRFGRAAVRLGLAVAPAVLYGAYALYPVLTALPYVAFVPWVLLYTDPRKGKVSALWFALGAWVLWIVNYFPQTSRYGWYAPLAMATFFFIPWNLYPFLIRPVARRFAPPRALLFPTVWVAVEWVRAEFSLSHFDLHLLGYSQGRFTSLIQVSDWTGVYGISFLVAAVNGWFADLWIAAREGGFRPALRGRGLRLSAAAIAGAFVLAFAYGVFQLATARHEEGPRLAVVQPNIRHTMRNAVGVHLGQVLLTHREVPKGAADLIVWPENAILDNLRREEGYYLDDLAWLGEEKGAWILLGAMGKHPSLPGRTSNSAFLVSPDGEIRDEYRKQMLYPWSEYIPFDGVFRRISSPLWRAYRGLVRGAWGYLAPGTAGDSMDLVEFPWKGGELPIGVIICVENTYPVIPAEAGRRGARLLVNITSEGEAAGIGLQEQLLRICMLRAVENRIPYVRCGNTGISAFLDGQGRLRALLRGERGQAVSDAGTLIERALLNPETGPTPYARSHDLFALTCLAVSILLALAGHFGGRSPAAVAAAFALGVLSTACGVAASDPAEALARGTALLDEGRASAAAAALRGACLDEAVCREALPRIADAFRQSRQAELASEVFGEIAGRHPALAPSALAYRGYFRQEALDFEGAQEDFRRSLEDDPAASTWALLGSLRVRVDDYAGAVEAFREASRLDPQDVQVRYRLNRAIWLSGAAEEAREGLEASVRDHPDHGPSWALLGRLRALSGDATGAEVAWQRALRADPSNIEARFMLARLALRAGKIGQARRWLREITTIEAGLGRGPSEG